jgi:sec-independent protein translocase protein TatA
MFGNVAFLDFSTPELIIILAIILLLFGSKKLPELSRSIGDSMRELRKGLSEGSHDAKTEAKTEQSKSESVS